MGRLNPSSHAIDSTALIVTRSGWRSSRSRIAASRRHAPLHPGGFLLAIVGPHGAPALLQRADFCSESKWQARGQILIPKGIFPM